jgi:predicted O-methyltransferase YrrM
LSLESVHLVRSNGLIAINNTLWNEKILNENDTTIETMTMHQTNEFVKNDQRMAISLLRLDDETSNNIFS